MPAPSAPGTPFLGPSLVASAVGLALQTVVVAAALVATALAGLRWLRVAQREHYVTGAVSRFARRWWGSSVVNGVALVVAGGAAIGSAWSPAVGLVTAVVVAVGPRGLTLRGWTAPLAWTRRLRTLAAVWVLAQLAVVAIGLAFGAAPTAAAVGAVAAPLLVDVALAVTAPVEDRLAGRYVAQAASRLRRVGPLVVAITGSYGKTSTKGYVAHLLSGSRTVVASPASFNNRAGLARSINEHLAPGTEVFVAEMGTFGPGEIAALCSWVPPDISVITALGPVHLERFGSEEAILAAKSEILVRAPTVVLAAGDPRLAAVADRCETEGKTVWRAMGVAGTVPRPDAGAAGGPRTVRAGRDPDGLWVEIEGRLLAAGVTVAAPPSNVACAVAVAAALGLTDAEIAGRLSGLPTAAHRLEPVAGPNGATVLDDTYNSNPAGAEAALARLAELGASAVRRIVVTPGMVELGSRQAAENERFGAAAAKVATDLVIVGRTNRRALVAGAAAAGSAAVRVVERRAEAVAWVRSVVGAGDVVLYENDLPDHFP
jgi:UDP-N-acetylmuramoyl-tripeptide--D-alanyl-D-alanine ligase